MDESSETNNHESQPSNAVKTVARGKAKSNNGAIGVPDQQQATGTVTGERDAVSGPSGPRVVPVVQAEPIEKITVAGGGKLVVPREEIGNDLDAGEDLDLMGMQSKKIRKPGRREWFALNLASELPVYLLQHKPKPDGMETDYYYVMPQLRGPIRDELKPCRVFVYYSYTTKTYALWIVHVTPDNSWYESVQTLLQQPAIFFADNAIRILSDKPNSRYRVKHKLLPSSVDWPAKSTEELLGEALGGEKFITTPDHQLYRDLIDGIELT